MKWLVALIAIAGCSAAAFSRLARISHHLNKAGPMMHRRIFGSVGVALGSLGWAAAVLLLTGIIRRGPKADWALLIIAALVSSFMAWTLLRADAHDKVGGDVTKRQRMASEELSRARREVLEAKGRGL